MKTNHWSFFILNLVYTWTFWVFAIIFGGMTTGVGFLFYFIGGTGPLVCALILVGFHDGSSGIRDLLSRMTNIRFIQTKWLLLSILIIFIPVVSASILEVVTFGTSTALSNVSLFFSGWSIWLISIIFNLIAVTFEEPGWRGLALESLQGQYTATISSIIVGIFWALWHLPLFVMAGTYQESLGLGTIGFWLYMSAIPATSILITWFYNNSQSSILAAMIFHLLNNLAGEIFSLEITLALFRVLTSYIIVALVIYYFGYEHLTRDADTQVRRSHEP